MPNSIHKTAPMYPAITILKERSARAKSEKNTMLIAGGKSSMMDNPPYYKLTITNKSCNGGPTLTLPEDKSSFTAVYRSGFKPKPILETVSISHAGQYGLTWTLSGLIKCFTKQDFDRVAKAACMPANEVTLEFGESSNTSWGTTQAESLSGLKIATYSFTYTENNTWDVSFTAVGPSIATKAIDIDANLNKSAGSLITTDLSFIGANQKQSAISVKQIITGDAQQNGTVSLDKVTEDVYAVPGKPHNYTPPGDYGSSFAKIALINGSKYFKGESGWFWSYWGNDETEKARYLPYYTLAYVIYRLVDGLLLPAVKSGITPTDQEDFGKLKYVFDNQLSKTVLDIRLRSGDPYQVVIAGSGNGDYTNNDGDGVNFDDLPSDYQARKGKEIDLSKILISRPAIYRALSNATTVKEAKSDTVDEVKSEKDQVINLEDFLRELFAIIRECTGSALDLKAVEHPDADKLYTKVIVDMNHAGINIKLPCIVFNPIDGDGSTSAFTINSGGGSSTYSTAIYAGLSKGGDALAEARGCGGEMEPVKNNELDDATIKIRELVEDPGNLAENKYIEEDVAALKSLMSTMYRNLPKPAPADSRLLHYPGIKFNATIKGTWGLRYGNAVWATSLPQDYRDNNNYLMVSNVTHTFTYDKWVTELEGLLAFHGNLDHVEL